jgi:hypothetical protein
MRGAYFIFIRILADKKDGAESDRQEKPEILWFETKEFFHEVASPVPSKGLIK